MALLVIALALALTGAAAWAQGDVTAGSAYGDGVRLAFVQAGAGLPAKKPDRTEEMIKEILAQLEAQRKELAELRKRPVATTAPAAPQKKPREHTPMMFIEHPPEKKTQKEEDLYWLGAGTWIPCTVEPRLNSDVPGYFTVKTRVPIYDTETGHHLLIKQNQSIVAKDESAALLFGNTRIPTSLLLDSRVVACKDGVY